MKSKLVYLAKIAVLSSVAALLMFLEFPLTVIAPEFYKLDLSELAVLVSGFALGPVAGVVTELIKICIFLLFRGTTTAFAGELANFLVGVAFVLPASLIYKYNKTFRGAVIGMTFGTLSLVVCGALANYFILIPAYSRFFTPLENIIRAGQAISKRVDGLLSFVLIITIPFNMIKGILTSILTALIYKRVSPILHK